MWEADSAFSSGSFAYNHFQFYNIYPYFFLAFRTVQWKLHKNGILIYFCSGFPTTNGTMHPHRPFCDATHVLSSESDINHCVKRLDSIGICFGIRPSKKLFEIFRANLILLHSTGWSLFHF